MIRILEVNDIDLPGKIFNGYDMISDLSGENFEIKQAVIEKKSNNKNVVKMLNYTGERIHNNILKLEKNLSIVNIFSITSPALKAMREYRDADIIHFHMFHNTRLSLYSLIEISKEKKVILSLHDPYFITGHCVHFFDCNQWKFGCKKCKNLDYLFPSNNYNTQEMWKLKKYVFSHCNIDIVVYSKWMFNLVKESPIFNQNKNIHLINFGIDVNKFCGISNVEAKRHYNISPKNKVLFLRAQNEFKGTEYVKSALNMLNLQEKINILTCDKKDCLNNLDEKKYNVIDLGIIDEEEMKYAYNACDIFLMPSKGESFGMMAVEAMSCSKPVIIFNNTALPSVTFAPRCGYLVEDKNSVELAKAIEFLINNEGERKKRGTLGREICQKTYSKEAYIENLKKLYINVYNKKIVNIDIKQPQMDDNEFIKKFFHAIKKNNNHVLVENEIEYSKPEIQELIMKCNHELYEYSIHNIKEIIRGCINFLKNIIKRNEKLYNIIKELKNKKNHKAKKIKE